MNTGLGSSTLLGQVCYQSDRQTSILPAYLIPGNRPESDAFRNSADSSFRELLLWSPSEWPGCGLTPAGRVRPSSRHPLANSPLPFCEQTLNKLRREEGDRECRVRPSPSFKKCLRKRNTINSRSQYLLNLLLWPKPPNWENVNAGRKKKKGEAEKKKVPVQTAWTFFFFFLNRHLQRNFYVLSGKQNLLKMGHAFLGTPKIST